MEVIVRVIAIFIEVVILAVLAFCFLDAVRLIAYDFGVSRTKFNKILVTVLLAVGGVLVTFFISHLITLYPGVWRG